MPQKGRRRLWLTIGDNGQVERLKLHIWLGLSWSVPVSQLKARNRGHCLFNRSPVTFVSQLSMTPLVHNRRCPTVDPFASVLLLKMSVKRINFFSVSTNSCSVAIFCSRIDFMILCGIQLIFVSVVEASNRPSGHHVKETACERDLWTLINKYSLCIKPDTPKSATTTQDIYRKLTCVSSTTLSLEEAFPPHTH